MPVKLKEISGGRILEVQATGKLTASDYELLVPSFERLRNLHGKLRVLLELRGFHGWTAGGLWQDMKFDTKHFAHIERLAIVGEKKWHKGMASVCRPFTTARIRFFKPDQMDAARQWLESELHTIAVAVFGTHREAEAAVKAFQNAGYDMKQLSIVGQDYHTEQHVVGYYNVGKRMKAWGAIGAFWGAMWGLLFGAAFFLIPGIGPVLVAGPLVASVVAALESAVVVGGLSVLGAALYSLGIPKNSVLKYETEIKAGKYLLLMTASMREIETAENEILKYNPPEEFSLHEPRCSPSVSEAVATVSGPAALVGR